MQLPSNNAQLHFYFLPFLEEHACHNQSVSLCAHKMTRVGHIYIRCTYSTFGREIAKYTVIYGAYVRFWPTTLDTSFPHSCICSIQEEHAWPSPLYALDTTISHNCIMHLLPKFQRSACARSRPCVPILLLYSDVTSTFT